MPSRSYNPAKVAVIVGGYQVMGYADGTFVSIAKNEDAWSLQVGSDGETCRSKSNNFSGTITIELLQSSPSNAILSGFAKLDQATDQGVFPVMIKDLSGKSLYSAEQAWIKKMPDSEFGREAGSRSWVIETGNLETFVGGN